MKRILILNLIISSFSLGFSINETTTIQYINDLLDKSAEDLTTQSVDEHVWIDMKKDDILSTSEMNDDPLKDFFVNMRYLEELEIKADEVTRESSKSDNPTTSESTRININSLEENESSDKSVSETQISNEDVSDENKSNDDDEKSSETRRANEGENIENKSGDNTKKTSDIREENEDKNIKDKSDDDTRITNETRRVNEGENIENKAAVDAEKSSETRRTNDVENGKNKLSEHSEEVSEQKTANEYENYSSKSTKEFSEIENTSDVSFDKAGDIRGNFQIPVRDVEKSDEHTSVNSENNADKISEKIDYKLKKPNDESHSDWDMLDDILDTRRTIFKDDYSSLENVRLEENYDEEVEADEEVFGSFPAPEFVTAAKNDNYDTERIRGSANINLPDSYFGPTRRGNFYNPNIFTIQHVNPLDFNSIVSRYGTNILRNNRLRTFARRNDLRYRAQDLDGSAESIESVAESIEPKTMADFESEQLANAYPYTPLVLKVSQESVPSSHYDDVMLKLIRASKKSQSADNLSWENTNLRGRFNKFRPNIIIPPRVSLFKVYNI